MENRSKKTAPGNAGETLHAALQPADGTRFAHNLDWNLLRVFFLAAMVVEGKLGHRDKVMAPE